MFSDVLLTVDFDRTLTAPDSTIPQRNIEAIRYFIENGGSFTVNTGRSVNTMGTLLDTIPVNAPFLLYNGSAAYENGQLINCKEIALDVWQMVDEIHREFPEVNIEIQSDGAHYLYDPTPLYRDFYDALGWHHRPAVPGTEITPFLKIALFGTVTEMNVSHFFSGSARELDRMDALEQWLGEKYTGQICVFRSAPRIIDIHADGVDKGIAARVLQRQLGKKILVCVGDAENDIAMLDNADYAFCPADGILADRYKNVCPCAQGAVADVIYKKIPEILHIQP